MKVTDWFVSVPDPYTPPECRGLPTVNALMQEDHPVLGTGKGRRVTSSAIVKIEGRRFTTQSGSVYEVEGPPAPQWLDAMAKADQTVDLDNPLKAYQ